jgi:DNA-directed RNA polymerase specialized sigma24 family protein
VVLLPVLHSFSVKESAEILGRCEGAIKGLQHRAVTALRVGIADRHGPEVPD